MQGEDQVRRREAARRRLRELGYRPDGYRPTDRVTTALVRAAGWDAPQAPQRATMGSVSVDTQTARKAAHNGSHGPPEAPIELVPIQGEPPLARSSPGRWARLLPVLMERPGVWHDAGVHSRGAGDHLRVHGVQIVKRGCGIPGKARIYLRWAPPEGG